MEGIGFAERLRNLWYRLLLIQGGAETIESLDDELDAMLDLARSPQSGTTTTTGAEQIIYTESGTPHPFAYGGSNIDLFNMAAGDTIRLRLYKKVKSGGVFHLKSDDAVNTYTGPQTIIKQFDGIYNTYGVEVRMQLLAGVNFDVDAEHFDAKRGS